MRHNGLGQTFGQAIALLVSAMLVPTGDAFAYQVAQTPSKDIEAATIWHKPTKSWSVIPQLHGRGPRRLSTQRPAFVLRTPCSETWSPP